MTPKHLSRPPDGATATAIETIGLKQIPKPFALIFTADEEIGLIGAKRLSSGARDPYPLRDCRRAHFAYGLCAPGRVTASQKSRLKGREAHSAYPALGSSAVFGAARLIARIEGIAALLRSEEHPAFDPAHTHSQRRSGAGGTAKNVIPGACRFTLEWRPSPDKTRSACLICLLPQSPKRKYVIRILTAR